MIAEKDKKRQSPIKIILIDDDEVIRIFMKDVFWVHGDESKYSVTTFSTLEEGMNALKDKETRPDFVFLDLSLPDQKKHGGMKIDGSVDFVKYIKQNNDLKHIKVAVFSGFKEKEIKDKLMEVGADHYLVKGDYLPKEIVDFVEKNATNH